LIRAKRPGRLSIVLTKTEVRKVINQLDIKDDFGQVYLPYALSRKYPNASREWNWQYVFPASKRYRNPNTG